MDMQLKRGLLDICVLAAIKQEDSYGYQIIKDIKPYGLERIAAFQKEWNEILSIYRFVTREEYENV